MKKLAIKITVVNAGYVNSISQLDVNAYLHVGSYFHFGENIKSFISGDLKRNYKLQEI